MSLEHGESLISVSADIIVVKEKGSFNKEGMTREIEELKLVIEDFADNEFKLLVDSLEVEGATPEAYDELNQFNIWLNSKKMVAKALLIKSPINNIIQYSRLPAIESQNIKSFDNRNEAISWLEQQ